MAVTYKYNAKTHSVDGYLLPTDGNMDKEVPRKPMPVLVPFVDWKDGEDVTDKFTELDTDKWYWAICSNCGWEGSSEKMEGGQIADTGDYGDVRCPKCSSDEIIEDKHDSYIGIVAIPIKQEQPQPEYNIAEDAELEKLAEDYAKKEEYGYTMQPHIIPAFIAGWKAKEAALKQDTVIIEISVYEIAYMHRYGNFAINVYVCPAANESDALNKFWEGRVKDNWEVKNITVHKAAIENDTAKQYLKSEYDLQIIKMKALGIDIESQTFEQCVNAVIYMAGGLQAKEDIESDAVEFAEWVELEGYRIKGMDNGQRQVIYKLFKNKQ